MLMEVPPVEQERRHASAGGAKQEKDKALAERRTG
jgi:hypothetical protein